MSSRSRSVVRPTSVLGGLLLVGALTGVVLVLSRSARQARAARAEVDQIPPAPVRPMP